MDILEPYFTKEIIKSCNLSDKDRERIKQIEDDDENSYGPAASELGFYMARGDK